MTRKTLLILCLAALPLSLAAKDRVYTWTDADGVVHYSQTEPEKIQAEAKDVRTSKASSTPPVAKKEKSQNELACERAKLNAEILQGKGPLQGDKDGDGKSEALTEEDRAAAVDLTKRQIGAYCQ